MLVMNKHHQLLINAPFGNSTERQTARGGTCHHNMSLTKNGYMMIHGSQFRKMMTNKGIFGASCFQITSDNPRFWWRWTKMKILLLSTSQAAQQTRILMKSTRSANKYQTPNDTKWHQMTSNDIEWHQSTKSQSKTHINSKQFMPAVFCHEFIGETLAESHPIRWLINTGLCLSRCIPIQCWFVKKSTRLPSHVPHLKNAS